MRTEGERPYRVVGTIVQRRVLGKALSFATVQESDGNLVDVVFAADSFRSVGESGDAVVEALNAARTELEQRETKVEEREEALRKATHTAAAATPPTAPRAPASADGQQWSRRERQPPRPSDTRRLRDRHGPRGGARHKRRQPSWLS